MPQSSFTTTKQTKICIVLSIALISFLAQRFFSYFVAYLFDLRSIEASLILDGIGALTVLVCLYLWFNTNKNNSDSPKLLTRLIIILILSAIIFISSMCLAHSFQVTFIFMLLSTGIVLVGCLWLYGNDKNAKYSLCLVFSAVGLFSTVAFGYYPIVNSCSFTIWGAYKGIGTCETNKIVKDDVIYKYGFRSKFGINIIPIEHDSYVFCNAKDGSEVRIVTIDEIKDTWGNKEGLLFTVFNSNGDPLDQFRGNYVPDSESDYRSQFLQIEQAITTNVGVIDKKADLALRIFFNQIPERVKIEGDRFDVDSNKN